jgi:hypothetical protein
MSGHGDKFSRKMEDAIAALLTQRNIDDAARIAGISTRTLMRWLKLPEFDEAYRKARRAAFSQSISRLQQASGAAVSTLLKIMVDPNAPTSGGNSGALHGNLIRGTVRYGDGAFRN